MAPDFVIVDGEGWFEYVCSGCGTEIRFGPYTADQGNEQFHQAKLKAEDAFRNERWSADHKCLRCQARRRARQAKGVVIRQPKLTIAVTLRKKFTLARARYTTIDDELHSASVYFRHLAAEIDTSAVATNKHGQIWASIETIGKEIEQLRRDIEEVQRKQGGA